MKGIAITFLIISILMIIPVAFAGLLLHTFGDWDWMTYLLPPLAIAAGVITSLILSIDRLRKKDYKQSALISGIFIVVMALVTGGVYSAL